MDIFIFILWLGLALLVGVVGKDRKIGFGMALLWAVLLSPLIGLVIALLSEKKKSEQEANKFIYYLELAKKAEFKGKISEAIDYYMDCLYHLENDYSNLDKITEEHRQKKIKDIKAKIEVLKNKVQQVS
ncbi:MAG: hypothetical protein PWR20_2432 [Bacteroidales bacterium]|nr:hypothetical protein [Bacteroidales bacterium]